MIVPAGKFKDECLALMDRVEELRTSITITKRGRPVAKLVPITEANVGSMVFGALRGTARRTDPHDALLATEEPWDAEG